MLEEYDIGYKHLNFYKSRYILFPPKVIDKFVKSTLEYIFIRMKKTCCMIVTELIKSFIEEEHFQSHYVCLL